MPHAELRALAVTHLPDLLQCLSEVSVCVPFVVVFCFAREKSIFFVFGLPLKGMGALGGSPVRFVAFFSGCVVCS